MCALELYTDRALRVLRFAAEEAYRNDTEEITPAHVLLALARDAPLAPGSEPIRFAVPQLPLSEPRPEAFAALGELEVAVGPERVARDICRAAGLRPLDDLRAPGPPRPAESPVHNGPEVYRALEQELRWAWRRRNTTLSTLHQLAGLIAGGDPVVTPLLAAYGAPDLKALQPAAVATRAERYERDQQMLRLAAEHGDLRRTLSRTIPESTKALLWNRRRLRRELRAQT